MDNLSIFGTALQYYISLDDLGNSHLSVLSVFFPCVCLYYNTSPFTGTFDTSMSRILPVGLIDKSTISDHNMNEDTKEDLTIRARNSAAVTQPPQRSEAATTECVEPVQ